MRKNTFQIDEQDMSAYDPDKKYTAGNLWLTGIVSAVAALGTVVGGGALAFNIMTKNGMIQVNGGDQDE